MGKAKNKANPAIPKRSGKVVESRIKTETGKTGMIRARIDPELKARAEAILRGLGLNASDAIRLFYTQVTLNAGLPFPVKVPNAETREAIRDAEAGNLTRHGSADEMFKKLGI
jgi:DNA-damage-inducible protein J